MRQAILRHQRLFVLSAVLVPVALLLAGWHYWALYSSMREAREDLLSVQARLSDVGLNLSDADLAVARERIDSADANVARAKTHMRWDPFLRAAPVVPGVGPQVDAVNDFLGMADLLVRIGDSATGAGAQAVALRDAPPSGEPLTESLVELLARTQPNIDEIDTLTAELVQKRLDLGDRKLLPPLNRARNRLDEELPKLANSVEQLQQAQRLLPGFLGFDGNRNYLVLALNSGELLPGGGLVTATGILPVTRGVNGELDFVDSTTWLDAYYATGGTYITPPGPLQRYLLRDYSWNLLVSNWTPDFTTWSQQALEFYEMVHGEQQVDGIVAVDLTVLERLLRITGPKTIDVAGAGPVTFDAETAVLQLEAFTRPAYEPADGDRKSVIGQLANVVISDLLKLPSEKWADAVDVVRDLGAERHIQVLSFRPEEQTIIRDVRWDGRIESPAGDFVQFNEASVMSTKLNLIIKPTGDYAIDVNELGDATHELTLRYHNPFPDWAAGKDPALVEQLMYQGLYGAYLRVFAPAGSTDRGVTIDGASTSLEDAGHDGDKEWFATFMPVPPGASREATFHWTVALATRDPRSYDLYLQKQPGTDGLCLDLRVTRNGAATRQITVEGGSRDDAGRICLTTDVRVHADF